MITGRKNVPQTNVASASKQSDDPEGFPPDGILGHSDRAGSGGTTSLSGGDSGDWIGMIDPQMLDLLVQDDVLDAVGNLEDIQLFEQ
jgi:hypothetical protein